MYRAKIIDAIHADPLESAKETAAKQQQKETKLFAVKKVEGAFAIAYSPVRVTKKKDRDQLGSDVVLTPVKRSLRALSGKTTQDLAKDGYEQVGDLAELMSKTQFAYTPNKLVS